VLGTEPGNKVQPAAIARAAVAIKAFIMLPIVEGFILAPLSQGNFPKLRP